MTKCEVPKSDSILYIHCCVTCYITYPVGVLKGYIAMLYIYFAGLVARRVERHSLAF